MVTRRSFLGGAAIAGSGAALGFGLGRRGLDAAVVDARFHADDILGGETGARLWYRYKFVGQAVMDNQITFLLGLAPNGLTDIGEVLDTAMHIAIGDEVSWFEAWSATARRVQGYAEDAVAKGHLVSASAHYLRAGCYWRAGLMRYARRDDPRIVEATRAALSCHDEALRLRGDDSHAVEIPYEGSALVGRVHYAPGVDRAPVILLHQGLHAWPEDTLWVVDAAMARGYHVLAMHGPGQGASLRLNGHPFRPDWEVPVGRALDFAAGLPRLDVDRNVLMGLSFGGFLAPRAASYEPRVRTLVADPGVVDWGGSMLRHFADMPGLLDLHANGPSAFDAAIAAVSKVWPDAGWYFEDVTWKHGVATPHALVDDLRRYSNADGVANIRARTLILDGVAEDATPGESKRLYDALTCDKTLIEFDATSGSQMHCQGGGTVLAATRLFDWLDENVAGGARSG